MGGIGFSLDLKRTGGDDALEVAELYAEVFRHVRDAIKKLAKGKAYRQVTEDYIDLCEEDGDAVRAGDQLAFGFKDSGGCNMSSVACDHWFKLVIAALRRAPKKQKKGAAGLAPLDAYVARRGWKIVDRPDDLKRLLAKSPEQLVEVKGVLHMTGTLDGAKFIESDVDVDGASSYDELSPKDRARVDQVMKTRRCPCAVCEALRKGATPAWPKDKPPAKARKKKYAGFVSLYEPRWKALPDDLVASTGITVLCLHAERVDTLPDALADLSQLVELRLEKTALKRVPAVIGRLPALKVLSLDFAPWETLADLPELPRLEELRLYMYGERSPLLATVPWERVPNLKKLYIGSSLDELPEAICDLEHLTVLGARHALKRLPKRLGRLKALEELAFDCSSLSTLPAALFGLPRLRALHLNNCPVRTLPEAIGKLPLVELCAYELRSLPDAIGDIATLETLTIGGEELRALPASLGRCRALKELRVSGSLEALPDLSAVRTLEVLDVGRTKVAMLPVWLKKLKHLRGLGVERTPMALPDWVGDLPLAWLRASKTQVGGEKGAARLEKALKRSKNANPEPLHVTDD